MRLHGLHFIRSLPLLLSLYLPLNNASPPRPKPPLNPLSHPERSLSLARALPSPLGLHVGFFHDNDDETFIIDWHIFHTLLPLENAASKLQSFYEDVAFKAATTLMTPSDRYLIRLGAIDLEVRSQVGDIPWTFVIGFANAMRHLATRGFTNTYQINYVHRVTGKLVTMSLWVGTVRWG